ncbi:hypothetical protein [Paraburkholderia bonniea]|uniref:hypothetical protein n=1 Tax=Paraburkholderia bonniea TaxID=2152891 RepID=UPI001FE65993|nr:hypothetical protein [Paraburkholderia bonniea]
MVTGLAGGNAPGSAAGAGIASIAAGKLNEISAAIAGSNPTGSADINTALGNIVANAIATGAGAAVGGNAGAVAGGNVDRFNRQLHPDEKQAIKNLANGDADKEHRLEAAGCALVHCAAEFAPGTADYAKYSALETEGAGYTAEQAQLQSYNGVSLSLTAYGGMVRQSSGGLFQYPITDSTADNKAMQAAMEARRPGAIDYVTLQGGAGVGGSTTINLHNGNVYAGASVSASRGIGFGIIFGTIPDSVGKTADQKANDTDNLLQGQSVGGNGCLFGVCGGLNHAVGGSTAVEIGVGVGGTTKAPNPGGNGSWGYSDQIFTVPGIGNAKH